MGLLVGASPDFRARSTSSQPHKLLMWIQGKGPLSGLALFLCISTVRRLSQSTGGEPESKGTPPLIDDPSRVIGKTLLAIASGRQISTGVSLDLDHPDVDGRESRHPLVWDAGHECWPFSARPLFPDAPPSPVDSPPADSEAPPALVSDGQALEVHLPDLSDSGDRGSESRHSTIGKSTVTCNRKSSYCPTKTRSSRRLAENDKYALLSKAMLRKSSLREGDNTIPCTLAVSKTIAKSRLCGVVFDDCEADHLSAFLQGSV